MKPGILKMLGLVLTVVLAAGLTATSTASATSTGVMAWGSNFFGELGTGNFQKQDVPLTLREPVGVSAISAGGGFSLALLETGAVESWGDDIYGELGNGTTGGQYKTSGAVLGLSEVSSISAGDSHGLALLKTGHVKAWGLNNYGQLGIGSEETRDEPAEIPELGNVVAISASEGTEEYSLAVTNGRVMAWGNNQDGQLGDGTTTGPEKCSAEACSRSAVEVNGLEAVTAVAAGPEHALALRENGTVWAWGDNAAGQLGDGSTESHDEPVQVKGLEHVVAIAAGDEFSLALLENGKVMAWGYGLYGELGDGKAEASHEPVTVSGLSEVIAISAGEEHSLALLSNGTVKSWGFNEEGDLGDGTYTGPEKCGTFPCSLAPVTVSEFVGEVTGISAGSEHSLALGPVGPIVSKVHPNVGSPSGGTEVTITGHHFSSVSAVKFGSTSAASFSVHSETEIVAVSPSGSGTVHITVTTEKGTIPKSRATSSSKFRYASAEAPEFGRCAEVAKGTGKYSSAACTGLMSEGSFEWTAGVEKKHFTLSAGESTLEAVGKATVTCKGGSGSGEYSSAKETTGTVIKLTGCEHAGAKCTSSGASEGELVTSTLEGELGWRSSKSGTVGLALAPSEEADFAEGKCGTTTVVILGSVIANLETDEMLKAAPWTFSQSGGKQKPEHFQSGPTSVLEMSLAGATAEQTGLALTITQTNEEKVEVNASV